MDRTPSWNDSDTDILIAACTHFDPSDPSQRMIIRMMVVPMLTRRLDRLRTALLASSGSELIWATVSKAEAAIRDASVRLGRACGG